MYIKILVESFVFWRKIMVFLAIPPAKYLLLTFIHSDPAEHKTHGFTERTNTAI